MTAYPSARRLIDELIHEQVVTITTADGSTSRRIRGQFTLLTLPGEQIDDEPGTVPVLIYALGGTETAVDRTDRIGVDVYGLGTDAEDVAEAIRERLVNDGMPHDLVAGYVDAITVESLPADVPYATPGVFQAQAIYRVTTRPL